MMGRVRRMMGTRGRRAAGDERHGKEQNQSQSRCPHCSPRLRNDLSAQAVVVKGGATRYIVPMSRRPRPKIVTLTDAAAARVKEIMTASSKPFLRVGVVNGGCAGMEYKLEYGNAREPMDELVEDHGVEILIKAEAIMFLLGSEIDYETSRLASKFVFRNPNQTDACGCGESVTIEPAKAEL